MPRLFLLLLLCSAVLASAQTESSRFEARHTHAIALTPDGTRLLVVHTPTASLSIFNVSPGTTTEPVLRAEIAVGLEPVSVRARTNNEAWVVNELSDSVSVVDLTKGVVVETLAAEDEPADVIFASGKAFVSCARNNAVKVYDGEKRTLLKTIALDGIFPRALAASADGSRVYAAFLLSGNRTTTLAAELAPPPPAPTNPALPPAPQTGLLVSAKDPRILYKVLDHDVAEIDVASLKVRRYLDGVGTNLYDLAVVSGELWVANTEALNLIRFEPALRGHFQDSRLSRIALGGGADIHHDLNKGLDYTKLPNTHAQTSALAMPMAVIFSPHGGHLWVAAHGSDQVAKVDLDGSIIHRVDLRRAATSGEAGTGQMRGPRSLALDPEERRLYVFNKLSDTVTVLDAGTGAFLQEFAAGSHDPTPERLKMGRRLFSDARLSGNGTVSCASCHPDGDQDGIAWDLGDPSGEMVFSTGTSIGKPKPQTRALHPMKGPMVTQTLRGLVGTGDLHWRADRQNVESFNVSFDKLQGGSRLPDTDMIILADYLRSLRHYPNPHLQADDSLPATLAGGNPALGRELFSSARSNCFECHALPFTSNNNIDSHKEVGSSQPLKNPTLRTVYQRIYFDNRTGHTARSGFGLGHDGTGFALPIGHPYVLDSLAEQQEFRDLTAFVLCVETGTSAAIGRSVTLDKINQGDPARMQTILTLEQQAGLRKVDLVVHGIWAGRHSSFQYEPVLGSYIDRSGTGGRLSREELRQRLQDGDAVTFLATLPGQASVLTQRSTATAQSWAKSP